MEYLYNASETITVSSPIPDDGGINCCRRMKFIAFRTGVFLKELRYINVTLL